MSEFYSKWAGYVRDYHTGFSSGPYDTAEVALFAAKQTFGEEGQVVELVDGDEVFICGCESFCAN